MIIVMKKKNIFIGIAVVLVIAVLAGCGTAFLQAKKVADLGKKIIVIDAGHGGPDKGIVGVNGTYESEKNLQIAKMLEKKLVESGFLVVMTRKNDGIANSGDSETSGFKNEDFKNRRKIIQNSGADMVISIHCNKFPSQDRRGIQVFYNPISAMGKTFADILQESLNSLNTKYVGKSFTALSGDYYMLNCTEAPSAIVECGFLSNPDDEKLLLDEDYLNDLVFSVYAGIVGYFG